MAVAPDSKLEALRAEYEAAYSAYQDHVAAVALAHSEDEGVSPSLIEQTAKALEVVRNAHRRYRAALTGAAADSA